MVADKKLPLTSGGGVIGREADTAALLSWMIFAHSSLDKLDVVVTLALDDMPP